MANPKALEFITNQLVGERNLTIDYTRVITLVTNASPSFRNQFLSALRNKRTQKLGELMISLVGGDQKTTAAAEAAQILSDDTLTSAEIDRIFK